MLKLAFIAVLLTGCAGKTFGPGWFDPKPVYGGPMPPLEKKTDARPVKVEPPKKVVEKQVRPPQKVEPPIKPIVGKTIIDHDGVFKQRMQRYIHCRHYSRTEVCVRPRKPP